MAFAILFRIHYWDQGVADRLSRLQDCAGGASVFVVPDVTRGAFDIPQGLRVFSVAASGAGDMGLVLYPKDNVFYFNADYPLYLFAAAHPDFDRYVLCEHDVEVRVDVKRLCALAEERGFDLLAMPNRIGPEGWSSMADTCAELFQPEEIKPHLVCFCVFSKRAIAHLASKRLEQAGRYRAEGLKLWAYCEGFIASQLIRDGFTVEDLSRHVSTAHYDTWPPYHEHEIASLEHGAVIHPVLAGARYVDNILRLQLFDVLSWFDARSALRRKLAFEPASLTLPRVGLQMLAEGHIQAFLTLVGITDPASLVPLSACVRWPDGPRPGAETTGRAPDAWQSSVSAWSSGSSREQDAARALTTAPEGRYAFHTDREINPWWICDLGSVRCLRRLTVLNRADAEFGRARGLRLFVGVDARNWAELPFDRASLDAFAHGPSPAPLVWEAGAVARYVRLEQSGLDFFHLDQVRIEHASLEGASVDRAQAQAVLAAAALRADA